MDPEASRQTMALSAVAGGVAMGCFHLWTLLSSGQVAAAADWIKAGANVVFACLFGLLVGYCLGPVIAGFISGFLPATTVLDPLATGFLIGFFGFELAPFAMDGAKRIAAAWAASKGGQ